MKRTPIALSQTKAINHHADRTWVTYSIPLESQWVRLPSPRLEPKADHLRPTGAQPSPVAHPSEACGAAFMLRDPYLSPRYSNISDNSFETKQ